MKKFGFINILILLVSLSYAQLQDTTIYIDEVVVSATRTARKIIDVPAQAVVVTASEIENFPVKNIDDVLKSVSNVYVNRSWGIFSKNSSVTMRGLEGSDRTLIMVDGVPKNKISGGAVNWHNINPENIERIEIIKGPASALYGNNAMGGIINIITKKPVEPVEGSVKVFGGQYNVFGGTTNLMGSNIKNDKGFYWGFNGLYRQGDGYVFELPENRDETDVQTYLQEYGAGTKLGYQFNKANSLEVIYDYYDELRGAGREVFEEGGSYNKYITNQTKLKYTGNFKNSSLNAIIYYNHEDYDAVKESLNDYDEYKLSDASSLKNDQGAWLTWSRKFFKNHYITIGGEVKAGGVIGDEIYRTSSDIIEYNGNMSNYALFLQDEMNFNKFKVVFGLRNDLILFNRGEQTITNPTKATGFIEGFYESFESNQWNAISPKLSVQYALNPNSTLYASYSTGIKPPKLDDLCKTGKIRKGFRLANPELEPESLTNYEIGYNSAIFDNLILNAATYYSIGEGFQYLVGTGDSIDTGGSELKPILYRENVSKIRVIGGELSLKYRLNKNLNFSFSYSYNNSVIIDYNISEDNPSKDLTGLYIVEVSPHLLYAVINWRNRYFVTNLNCNYVDSQWADDENTLLIEDYFIVNLRLSKTFLKSFNAYVDAQNILDVEYIDRKGQVNPGRFIMLGIKYSIILKNEI